MTERERTPPDLAALFEKESRGYDGYASGKAASYARVVERIALTANVGSDVGGPGATNSPSTESGTTGSSRIDAHATGAAVKSGVAGISVKVVVGIAAASLAVGVFAGRATAPDGAPATPPPPSTTATNAAAASTEPWRSPSPVDSSIAPPAPDVSSSSLRARDASSSTSRPPTEQGSLAQERALVEGARSALSRGRAADALAAADQHSKSFPRGSLAEEREVLAITALLSLGRVPEAQARRTRFVRDFPQSLLVPPSIDGGAR